MESEKWEFLLLNCERAPSSSAESWRPPPPLCDPTLRPLGGRETAHRRGREVRERDWRERGERLEREERDGERGERLEREVGERQYTDIYIDRETGASLLQDMS